MVRLETSEALINKLVYIATNPVKGRLVEHIREDTRLGLLAWTLEQPRVFPLGSRGEPPIGAADVASYGGDALSHRLRILIVEDTEADTALVVRELSRSGSAGVAERGAVRQRASRRPARRRARRRRFPLAQMASRVVLEVTERAALSRSQLLAERIARLRELRYRLAVDDIGAGYSGLTSFAELVKIDIPVRQADLRAPEYFRPWRYRAARQIAEETFR